jgi:ABC-type polysaccharide/polyol phosphate export permease
LSALTRLRADIKEMVTELVEYRELLRQMVTRELLIRYKQSVIGIGWAIFVPLVQMIIFTFIFTRVARIETHVPYPIFLYCGLLPWTFFSSTLKHAVMALVGNKNLVTKIYFPREIFAFSDVFVGLVDFIIGSSILVVLMIYYSVVPTWTVLLVPVILAIQVVFTMALSLILAMSNLFFRDVKYIFDVFITLWMFASPVVYPTGRLRGSAAALVGWNPMTHIINGYRAVIIDGTIPPAGPLAATAAFAVGLLFVAWVLFHRAEFKFAENV